MARLFFSSRTEEQARREAIILSPSRPQLIRYPPYEVIPQTHIAHYPQSHDQLDPNLSLTDPSYPGNHDHIPLQGSAFSSGFARSTFMAELNGEDADQTHGMQHDTNMLAKGVHGAQNESMGMPGSGWELTDEGGYPSPGGMQLEMYTGEASGGSMTGGETDDANATFNSGVGLGFGALPGDVEAGAFYDDKEKDEVMREISSDEQSEYTPAKSPIRRRATTRSSIDSRKSNPSRRDRKPRHVAGATPNQDDKRFLPHPTHFKNTLPIKFTHLEKPQFDPLLDLGVPSDRILKNKFNHLVHLFLLDLDPRKRYKAIVPTKLYDEIVAVKREPSCTTRGTPQFRFWCKRQFDHGQDDMGRAALFYEGRKVAKVEDFYAIVTNAHEETKHGGRDRTMACIRKTWSYLPKEIVARFVAECPGCPASRNKGKLAERTSLMLAMQGIETERKPRPGDLRAAGRDTEPHNAAWQSALLSDRLVSSQAGQTGFPAPTTRRSSYVQQLEAYPYNVTQPPPGTISPMTMSLAPLDSPLMQRSQSVPMGRMRQRSAPYPLPRSNTLPLAPEGRQRHQTSAFALSPRQQHQLASYRFPSSSGQVSHGPMDGPLHARDDGVEGLRGEVAQHGTTPTLDPAVLIQPHRVDPFSPLLGVPHMALYLDRRGSYRSTISSLSIGSGPEEVITPIDPSLPGTSDGTWTTGSYGMPSLLDGYSLEAQQDTPFSPTMAHLHISSLRGRKRIEMPLDSAGSSKGEAYDSPHDELASGSAGPGSIMRSSDPDVAGDAEYVEGVSFDLSAIDPSLATMELEVPADVFEDLDAYVAGLQYSADKQNMDIARIDTATTRDQDAGACGPSSANGVDPLAHSALAAPHPHAQPSSGSDLRTRSFPLQFDPLASFADMHVTGSLSPIAPHGSVHIPLPSISDIDTHSLAQRDRENDGYPSTNATDAHSGLAMSASTVLNLFHEWNMLSAQASAIAPARGASSHQDASSPAAVTSLSASTAASHSTQVTPNPGFPSGPHPADDYGGGNLTTSNSEDRCNELFGSAWSTGKHGDEHEDNASLQASAVPIIALAFEISTTLETTAGIPSAHSTQVHTAELANLSALQHNSAIGPSTSYTVDSAYGYPMKESTSADLQDEAFGQDFLQREAAGARGS